MTVVVCIAVILAMIVLAATGEADKPALWLVGDSTVNNGDPDEGTGWGEVLSTHFDTDRIDIRNHAIGARSSRTYRLEGRWDEVLNQARPGDFVIFQFGHNDIGDPRDQEKPRATLLGMGEETLDWHNHKHDVDETIHTFGWYMKRYATEAKDAGLIPIICSYVPRAPKPGETVSVQLDDEFGTWSEQAAAATGAAFINLYSLVAAEYVKLEAAQPHGVKEQLFVKNETDYTHPNAAGARLNAEMVVAGIRTLGGEASKLASFLK